LTNEVSFLVVLQVLQFLAGMLGCMVVGAGNHNAILYGAVAGAINGIIFMYIQSSQPAAQNTLVSYYSQPLLHTTFGTFGSILGAWIWPPLPTLIPLAESEPTESPIDLHRKQSLMLGFGFGGFSWQVHWIRVLFGTAIAVAGVMSADRALRFVVHQQIPAVNNVMTVKKQQQLFTVEIAALALFIGGSLAGASTWNGGVQGLCVGGFSAIILMGYQIATGGDEFVLKDINPIWEILGVIGLGTVGGWLASVILPPIATTRAPKFRGLHYS
jgi:hypothetical protein